MATDLRIEDVPILPGHRASAVAQGLGLLYVYLRSIGNTARASAVLLTLRQHMQQEQTVLVRGSGALADAVRGIMGRTPTGDYDETSVVLLALALRSGGGIEGVVPPPPDATSQQFKTIWLEVSQINTAGAQFFGAANVEAQKAGVNAVNTILLRLVSDFMDARLSETNLSDLASGIGEDLGLETNLYAPGSSSEKQYIPSTGGEGTKLVQSGMSAGDIVEVQEAAAITPNRRGMPSWFWFAALAGVGVGYVWYNRGRK